MEKYLVVPATQKRRPITRHRWKRSLLELNGRFEPNYRHQCSRLIIESYSEIGSLPHNYHINGEHCPSHLNSFIDPRYIYNPIPNSRMGISSLEFDSKGIYLASVTKSGCLTVHDFDNVQSPDLLHSKEDEAKQLLHISMGQQLDVVRWNLSNQDEVACTSRKISGIYIFDIGYISSEPIEVLRKRPSLSVHGYNAHEGYCDVAFSSDDNSRLLASDTNGVINVWDRRVSNFPCSELIKNSTDSLNSIKLSGDNEIIYGASRQGTIYMWDLRGGRSSSAFGNQNERYFSPLMAVKLANELEKITSLKAQANIVSKEIHSINIDPSCPNQLAFHLDDGWSGVLDTNKLQVTHIHCPPSSWLDEFSDLANLSHLRKPCWLPINSIYVVGSSSSNGLYLLDFYPDRTSPCHVDYNEDIQRTDEATCQRIQNRYWSVSEGVTACVAHPLNGTIVAGTVLSSLMVISQTKKTC